VVTEQQKSVRPVPFLLPIHPISETEKSLAFHHDLSCPDLQRSLILPARREAF
jgi:hypothetical protein